MGEDTLMLVRLAIVAVAAWAALVVLRDLVTGKACPHCRKGVSREATICPYCRSTLG